MEKEKEPKIFLNTNRALKQAFKSIKLLPIISYLCLFIFIGIVIQEISSLGNVSFIISFFVIPIIGGVIDWFSDTDLLKTFREDWSKAPTNFHLLVIFSSVIYYHAIGEFKELNVIKEKYESK